MTGTHAAAARPRRSDAAQALLTERDITGMLLVAEQHAAPYDLLAEELAVPPARVRAINARWHLARVGNGGLAQRAVSRPAGRHSLPGRRA